MAQPTTAAWFQAKLKRIRPATPVKQPRKSNSDKETGCVSSLGMTISAAKIITTQTIAREKNAHGHQASCANIAEKTAPATQPVGAAAPKSANTMFFFGLAP